MAEAAERGFLSGFDGAKTNPRLFRAGVLRPTTRGHESCSGRPQRAIIGKFAGYFRETARQNRKEILCIHVLRTADTEAWSFPRCGKLFSTVWKNGVCFFHSVEKDTRFFPWCGNFFSTVWKTGGPAVGGAGRERRHGGAGGRAELIHPRGKPVGVYGGVRRSGRRSTFGSRRSGPGRTSGRCSDTSRRCVRSRWPRFRRASSRGRARSSSSRWRSGGRGRGGP